MNIAGALRRLLPSENLETLAKSAEACAQADAAAYLVGGSVRDTLLGRTDQITDLDLVIEGAIGPALDSIAAQIGDVTSRSEFMTLKISCGSLHIDLVRARSETYESPGALPVVRPGTLEEDLARRDFTINAMAVVLDPERWGDLIDPHGGQADLESGIVRTLHNRSFEDDPTRIFRAVRYAGRLGFDLASDTRTSLGSSLKHIEALSGDRLRHELERIFAEPAALPILSLAREEGVLEKAHPALARESSALGRLRDAGLPDNEGRGAALLAALLWDAARVDRLAIRDRLRLSAAESRLVDEIGEFADPANWPPIESIAPSHIRERLAGFSVETLEASALLTTSEPLRSAIRLYLDRLRHVRSALRGADLIALGVPEGPGIGELLDQMRDARLDGVLTSRQDEERWVLERLDDPEP